MPRKTGAAGLVPPGRQPASMRPRPDAAENRASATPTLRADARFNEAAARCRGKPYEMAASAGELGVLQ